MRAVGLLVVFCAVRDSEYSRSGERVIRMRPIAGRWRIEPRDDLFRANNVGYAFTLCR
jgi:hypothetical protein